MDKNKGKQMAIFASISREKYYDVKKIKFRVPPCGAYNINHLAVERIYRPLNWNTPKNHSKVNKIIVEPPMRLIELPNDSKSIMNFGKYSQKMDIKKMQSVNPHEKQFEPFNYEPDIFTKTKYFFLNLTPIGVS